MQQTDKLSQFLLDTLPVSIMASLTFPRQVKAEEMSSAWDSFIDECEKRLRTSFGWVRSYEKDKGGVRHIHALIVTPKDISHHIVNDAWNAVIATMFGRTAMAGLSVCERYEREKFGYRGVSYVLKDDDVAFSWNIDWFHPSFDVNTLNHKQRDRYTRMMGKTPINAELLQVMKRTGYDPSKAPMKAAAIPAVRRTIPYMPESLYRVMRSTGYDPMSGTRIKAA